MVLVGMGTDDVVQMGHAVFLQDGIDRAAVSHVAAVDEQALPAAGHQSRICLSYVDKQDPQFFAVCRCRRGTSANTAAHKQI